MQLPQEYSGDLNLCDIGEPTHDILLEVKPITITNYIDFQIPITITIVQLQITITTSLFYSNLVWPNYCCPRLGIFCISLVARSIKLTLQLVAATQLTLLSAPTSSSEYRGFMS